MDYYYKYLKYKTKYLELKGGKMEYGLYGLYSYIGNNLNLRTNNKRFNEINYVHDLPLYNNNDNIIIQHLRDNCTIDNNNITEYYPKIKSFEFIPYDKKNKSDTEQIQKLINTTYFTEDLDIDNLKWTTINKLKRFRYRGYSKEISEQIINLYAKKANELLKKTENYELDGYTEIRKKALELQSKRRCDAIHINHDNTNSNPNINLYTYKVILEELIEDRQLLLSSVNKGKDYNNNPKIYRDPYTLANEKLGVLSWNLIINKASINCIMQNHDVLFPIRIILDIDSRTLFYDNILNSKKYTSYMGFFLIRFINDDDDYTKCSKPHNSKEQYYIFFVFKNENKFFNLPLFTYTLTNFRNNIVNWGTVTEKKTVLFYEILQLICMYLNNNVYFYLISIENEHNNNNITKSWIFSKDLNDINIEKNEIHILVSKYNIDNISYKLNKPIWNNKKYKYIEYNEKYKLIQCHFGWYPDPNDKFCIKLGDMKNTIKDNLKNNACINKINSEMFKFDKLRYIQTIGKNNIMSTEDITNFDFGVDAIIDLKINEFLH